jgi:hypothetical protein
MRSRDSSVGIVMGYWVDDQGWIPGKGRIILFSIASGQALGPTQPPIQWVQWVIRQWREGDHSLPTTVEVNNGGAIPQLPNMSSWQIT